MTPFRAEVEAFLVTTGWKPTRFGREMTKDPTFVARLREGRDPRERTLRNVRARMAEVVAARNAELLRLQEEMIG